MPALKVFYKQTALVETSRTETMRERSKWGGPEHTGGKSDKQNLQTEKDKT